MRPVAWTSRPAGVHLLIVELLLDILDELGPRLVDRKQLNLGGSPQHTLLVLCADSANDVPKEKSDDLLEVGRRGTHPLHLLMLEEPNAGAQERGATPQPVNRPVLQHTPALENMHGPASPAAHC
jgi:hypothetical protein